VPSRRPDLRSLTPGPPPFSLMNSMPAYAPKAQFEAAYALGCDQAAMRFFWASHPWGYLVGRRKVGEQLSQGHRFAPAWPVVIAGG